MLIHPPVLLIDPAEGPCLAVVLPCALQTHQLHPSANLKLQNHPLTIE